MSGEVGSGLEVHVWEDDGGLWRAEDRGAGACGSADQGGSGLGGSRVVGSGGRGGSAK